MLEEPLAEAELLRDRGAALPRYDVRAYLGEPALGRPRKAVEDGTCDRQLENAVTKELEPLVGVGAVVDPGRVREDLLEARGRELRDQPPELGCPGCAVLLSPDAR
jgi:hypothetical protein